MEMRETLLRLLPLLALFVTWVIFTHSVFVLQDCLIAIASLILLVVIPLLSFVIALRPLEEISKVAGILVYSAVFLVGLVMAVVILHIVVTGDQPEGSRFLLACILGKSPQENGILTLSTLAIAIISLVFFTIAALYGAFSLVKLISSKKLT